MHYCGAGCEHRILFAYVQCFKKPSYKAFMIHLAGHPPVFIDELR
jgi:hypothetical protein